MTKKYKIFVTKAELRVVEERVVKMSGFNATLSSIKQQLDKYNISMRIFNNEIKALNKRIDNLEKRFKNVCQQKRSGINEVYRRV